MKLRGDSAFIAGEHPSLGDFYVAPICFLVSRPQMPTKSSPWMVSPDGGSKYR
jgi:glutathione S-transferase